jgi:hypothetical protein
MRFDFPSHRSGDTWAGINAITILENGSAVNLTNCKVYIQFRSVYNLASPPVLTLSTENNTIAITFPVAGVISIPSQIISVPVGVYRYDLQVDFPSGESKTYLEGNFEIKPGITTPYFDTTPSSRFLYQIINSLYSLVSSSSSFWNYQGTDIKELTGYWQEASTAVYLNSATWQIDPMVRMLSSNWQSSYNIVYSNSAIWQDVSTVVQNNSSYWLIDSLVRSLSSNWERTYTTVSLNSATNWSYQGTDLKSLSANWQSSYTTLCSTSAKWNDLYTTVNLNSATNWSYQGTDLKELSANWQSSYVTLCSLSGQWNDLYTTVKINSATNWSYQGTDLKELSANWQSSYVTLCGLSGQWDTSIKDIYTTVNLNSATNWSYQGTDLKELSANWQSSYTTLCSTSAKWNDLYTTVNLNSATNWSYQGTDLKELSANWQSSYVTLCSLSGNFTSYSDVYGKFLPLSGGTISGNLNILSSVEIGSGGTIFYVSTSGKIGINTEDLTHTLTVSGDIKTNNVIYDNIGNSLEWNSVYSTVYTNSAKWLTDTSTTQEFFDDFLTLGAMSTLPHAMLRQSNLGGAIYVEPENSRQGVLVINTNPLPVYNQRGGAWSGLTIHFGQGAEYRLIFTARRGDNSFNEILSGRFDMGFHDQIGTNSTIPNDGCFFTSVNGETWKAITVADTQPEIITDTGVPCDTAWRKFEIKVNSDASQVFYYIDNVLVANHTESIPKNNDCQTAIGYRCFRQSNSPTNVELRLDWQSLTIKRQNKLWE